MQGVVCRGTISGRGEEEGGGYLQPGSRKPQSGCIEMGGNQ